MRALKRIGVRLGVWAAAAIATSLIAGGQERAVNPGDPIPGITPTEFEEFRVGVQDVQHAMSQRGILIGFVGFCVETIEEAFLLCLWASDIALGNAFVSCIAAKTSVDLVLHGVSVKYIFRK